MQRVSIAKNDGRNRKWKSVKERRSIAFTSDIHSALFPPNVCSWTGCILFSCHGNRMDEICQSIWFYHGMKRQHWAMLIIHVSWWHRVFLKQQAVTLLCSTWIDRRIMSAMCMLIQEYSMLLSTDYRPTTIPNIDPIFIPSIQHGFKKTRNKENRLTIQENKKFGSHYTEVSAEHTNPQIRNPAWTVFPVSCWVFGTVYLLYFRTVGTYQHDP